MANPILTVNNAALRAAEGSGDGTIYATATSATVDQANKRFTLVGLAIIADLGADVDDKFNGYELYWPASKAYYLITDWEAALDRATVDDVPATTDIGACEIRRRLYCPDADAAAPIPRAVNGQPSIPAKIRAANVALTIDAHLPNLVGQNGFEELPVAAIPTTAQPAGKWSCGGDLAVSATSPLLGSRMAVWTPGASQTSLLQTLTGGMSKGKPYRVLLKLRAVTGATLTNAVKVRIKLPNGNDLDTDWNPGVGQGSYNPGIIGTAAAWYLSGELVPEADTAAPAIEIVLDPANKGAATAVDIDEIAVWEAIPVASLVAFGHNWDGAGGGGAFTVRGYRCSPSRTSVAAADYAELASLAAVAGSGPFRAEFTAGIFPIYRITLAANADYQYEVGELLLGQSWPWLSVPELGLDPQAREYDEQRRKTKSGAETRTLYAEQRRIETSIRTVKAADRAIWSGIFRERHRKGGEPFAAYWAGHWDEPLLFTCQELKMPYQTIVPDVAFIFVEAK